MSNGITAGCVAVKGESKGSQRGEVVSIDVGAALNDVGPRG